jgi:chorismate dehydratase
LTVGIDHAVQFVVPSKLAEMLRANLLDAALVSIAEVLFNDGYDVLDDVAIASTGAVFSVHLAHRRPLSETSTVYCDTASLTGVNLLRVLLAERGLNPDFQPLDGYEHALECDAVLLIGDRAIDFQLSPHPHRIFDLGAAWHELTGLPFVFAVWALRRGLQNGPLRRALIAVRDMGRNALPDIILGHGAYTREFRQQYFTRHVRYELGEQEKCGIREFVRLLRKQGRGPVYDPVYVR